MQSRAAAADALSLDELAIWHGTDKSSKVHGYTRAYEAHFAPLRHEPIALLEIGVGSGDSLRLWRDYFPNAKVYGVDVKDCLALAEQDVTLFRGSQSDASFLDGVAAKAGGFDLVIDDGSHFWADQLAAFKALFAHVRPKGYYVVEDLHTSYWDAYRRGEERPLEFFLELIHELNLRGRSGYGTIENDPEYAALSGQLSAYQRTVESVTFYKSLVFVQKKVASGRASE